MPLVPNSAVMRVVHRLDRGGVPMYNVMYHGADFVHTPATMATSAAVLGTLYINTILEQLANVINYEECIVYSMASVAGPTGNFSAPDPSPGGLASEGTARGAAAVVTLRTANRGRSGRGRTYLPGIAEGSVSNGVLDGGYATSLEAAYSNYWTGAEAESVPLLVYSQFTGGAPRSTGLIQEVTGVEIRSAILGSQRRRNQRP